MIKYLLNSPIIPNPGTYKLSDVSLEEAGNIAFGAVSAIGHQATASYLSKLLGMEIPVNRMAISMQPGDLALVFRVEGRLPEGKVLTLDELTQYPFQLYKLERLE